MVSVYPTMYTLLSNPSYMKSRSLRSFTSVVLCFTPKNVLFWALEEITWPGAWDHDRLGDRFLGLTFRLLVYLDEGYLPQYFCPAVNLLEDCTDQQLDFASQSIREFLSNPQSYLGQN